MVEEEDTTHNNNSNNIVADESTAPVENDGSESDVSWEVNFRTQI